MGDDVNLRLRLTGQDAGAGKTIDEADKKVGILSKSLKGLGAVGAAAGAAAAGLLAKSFSDNLDISHANNRLKAQLNLTTEGAEKAGKVAGAVFADNWGDSIQEVDDALRAVAGNMVDLGDTSDEELQSITEKALAVAQTFNVDVNDATRAAGKLIASDLAKDSTEAFDIISAGFAMNLDASGDFLDTLNEYAPQFQQVGITGTQMLGILQDGARDTARDTDAIADSFKEFANLVLDKGSTAADGFKILGINADEARKAMAAGGDAAGDLTFKVMTALNEMDDGEKRNTAGIALFGSTWEDTVRHSLPSLARMSDAQDVVRGSGDALLKTLGDDGKTKIESAKRSFDVWVQGLTSSKGPIGDASTAVVAFGSQSLATAGSVGQVATGLAAMRGGLVLSKVAMVAGAVATGIATAAQWAWNAALTANPIGVIIVAIAALVAALVYFFTKTTLGRAIFSSAMSAMVTAVNWLKNAGGAAVDWLTGKWNAFWGFLSGLPGRIRGMASGMWTGITDFLRSALNSAIGLINRFHWHYGGFSVMGQTVLPSFDIGFSVPYLARGGIVTKPTLLVAGEAGPEKIKPLSGAPDSLTIIINGFMGDEDALLRRIQDTIQRAEDTGSGTSLTGSVAAGWS